MRNFFILLGIFFALIFCTNFASAEITVKDYMSYEFLDTQGYSGAMLHLVEVNKAKTFGEELPSPWPSNPIARFYRKFTTYYDPAEDYGDFGVHEIYIRPSVWDY